MNFSKNFLLLLTSLIFCFVAINCSEIPSSSGENSKKIVNKASGISFVKYYLKYSHVLFSAFLSNPEAPSFSGITDFDELIVGNAESNGNNSPYLPDNFFGSYKLIRPLNKPFMKLYMNYDAMAVWWLVSYWLSHIYKNPKINQYASFALASVFAAFHLPSYFGHHWVASIKNSAQIVNGPIIKSETDCTDEIFLARGIVPFNRNRNFPVLIAIYRVMIQSLLAIFGLRRARE